MDNTAIFLPMLVQICLTLAMFILLGIRKSAAVKAGKIDRQQVALDNSAWNKEVIQVSNNIANQFQTPVLFYLLVMYFFVTASVSIIVLILSWLYAVSRMIHAVIHVTSNKIPYRLGSFLIGLICLLVMTGFAIYSYISIL